MMKNSKENKSTVYQSSSPWFVVCAIILIILIIGLSIYRDVKIDGILFNDVYLYKNQIHNIFLVFVLMFGFSIFSMLK